MFKHVMVNFYSLPPPKKKNKKNKNLIMQCHSSFLEHHTAGWLLAYQND